MSTNLIARVLPYLPGTLVEGSAIDIAQSGTTYTISWDSTEAGFSTFGLQLGGAANAAAAQALLVPPLAWRNIIAANGGLEVWQRGAGGSASIAVPAGSSGVYTGDRWYCSTQANQASTVAQVAGIVSGSRWAAKVQRNSGQTGTGQINFGFPLDSDEIAMIAGQVCTLSFTAKAGANFSPTASSLLVFLITGTGTPVKFPVGYTGGATPINSSAVLTTAPQRFTFVSSALASNIAQAEVTIVLNAVGTAGADDSFTIDDVQLEVGTFASAFERVPFEKMLLACKRHFWKTFLYGTAPVQNAGANTGELHAIAGKAGAAAVALYARHPVSMRAAPTVTTFNPSAANAQVQWESGATGATTATATANLNTETVDITATGNASAALGDTIGVHLTVDAGI